MPDATLMTPNRLVDAQSNCNKIFEPWNVGIIACGSDLIEADQMSSFVGEIVPGKSLGFLLLGASLFSVIERLKEEPSVFTKIDVLFNPDAPVTEPVIVGLPSNGLRLRFDGPDQQLRLIEVLDFSKSTLTYNGLPVVKTGAIKGPTFKHVYNTLVGMTEPGEFIPSRNGGEFGTYILSWPGMACSFPVLTTAWAPTKDFVEVMSSSAALCATSMAIYYGRFWPDVRDLLFMVDMPDPRTLVHTAKSKDLYAEQVVNINIMGAGRLELQRGQTSQSFIIQLGQSTPQDLIGELGPPDAMYQKVDDRINIHRGRAGSEASSARLTTSKSNSRAVYSDTDQSSVSSAGNESETNESDSAASTGEHFYNYFHHGFDILMAPPVLPSPSPPSQTRAGINRPALTTSAPHVATKFVIHSNVPGSYLFNRYRRCRWAISYLSDECPVTSETRFAEIRSALQSEWQSSGSMDDRGMVLNRDFETEPPSPSSSCEMLGNFEGADSLMPRVADGDEESTGLGNTTLFGFPGLVFEVMKNDVVSGVTVF